MTRANEGYLESIDELSGRTRDMRRAIISLMAELATVDWHSQRATTLEWIQRKDPGSIRNFTAIYSQTNRLRLMG